MRFNPSKLSNTAAISASNTHSSDEASDVVAALRAMVERDFSSLRELQPRVFQLALNEAEALAWQTGFPELVFPTLAHEKASNVATWHEHQKAIRETRPSPALAA